MRTKHLLLASITLLILISSPAESQFWSGSRLLLPYFEVDIDSAATTTFFSVTNTANEPVQVRATIHSNWGIEVLVSDFTLDAHDVFSVNLFQWLAEGQLPDRTLSGDELEYVRSAFCGEPAPPESLYFSDEVSFRRAVGYVVFQVIDGPADRDVLIGDYFVLTPGEDYAQGQALINIDPAAGCDKICYRHGLRFMSGGFDAGTDIFIWTGVHGEPSQSAYYPDDARVATEILVYDEDGVLVDTLWLQLLPVELIRVGDLDLPEQFGWFDIRTAEKSFISVRYGAFERFSVGLKTFCLRTPEEPVGPAISLQKRTNGIDADFPPGPTIQVGAPVTWEYIVTNTGDTTLQNIVVTDDQEVDVTCPSTSLQPGGSMTCTGNGIAEPCQYVNLGTVTAIDAEGDTVQDDDPSHYFGLLDGMASVDIEKETRGENGVWFDADGDSGATAPFGPQISEGGAVSWRYIVTNTGTMDLSAVTVADDQGVTVSCPTSTLAAGETMTCTGHGFAPTDLEELYQYRNVGSVDATAVAACGQTIAVSDSDPSHYYSEPSEQCERPFVIQDRPGKLFGRDALEPGPWTEICSFGDREINNLSYRRTDGFLYGVELTNTGNTGFITKIQPTSCAVTLLEVEGLPDDRRFDAGDISSDGRWMYVNFAGISQAFYRVDLSSSLPLQAEELAITGHTGYVHDWAFRNGKLYGGDRAGQVSVINLATLERTDVSVPGLPADNQDQNPYGAYGGALLGPTGHLILHRNSGHVYEIDISDPANPTLVSESAARSSGFNDAVCADDS